jgi:hypothetical protein
MKRRKYIKTAALGAGAITFGSGYSFASTRKEKVKIGWLYSNIRLIFLSS